MKERRKPCEDIWYYSSSSSDLPCQKHLSTDSVGICALCLEDRLIQLVCSDCGGQRLSSCSCSEFSSNPNSSTFDIRSVSRVSFLIENEFIGDCSRSGSRLPTSDEKVMPNRSNSSCVEIKRGSLWSIGRLFKREKGSERISVGGDEKSDRWLFDQMRVSRSRSSCGEEMMFSVGRSSVSGARTSSVNGGMVFDSGRRSEFGETEPRKSVVFDHDPYRNLTKKRIFSLKETDFNGSDESEFIDFKLEFTSELNPEFSATKGDDTFTHGRGIQREITSSKAWRWIFRPPRLQIG